MTEYKIRQGNIEDAEALADVETACFPPAEAATAEEIAAPNCNNKLNTRRTFMQ